jgi:hypothetical protein
MPGGLIGLISLVSGVRLPGLKQIELGTNGQYSKCDLCGEPAWVYAKSRPYYCRQCDAIDPITRDDVLDATETLNHLKWQEVSVFLFEKTDKEKAP